MAGISAEYYLRLEQGRDRNPSAQVLEALARALRLDAEARAHLWLLAGMAPPMPREADRPESEVPDGIRVLLDTIGVPAFVLDRYRTVLAVNALARALEPSLEVGTNRLLSLFTDPDARSAHPDWENNTASVVAQLRSDIGADDADPRFKDLVRHLSAESARFRELWARHDVSATGSDDAAQVTVEGNGTLILRRERLFVDGTDLVLVIYHPDPGTAAAAWLDGVRRADG
ncbi:hypothetical protein GCM10009851_11800 [Herbiconiux moechotypicola]|uniref:HTH cro/C1-type domain-containing protein n=1 Tax=Herbiconiux moechotypicola TaxID=637393 RepID=A0ABN3DEC9_9MICO